MYPGAIHRPTMERGKQQPLSFSPAQERGCSDSAACVVLSELTSSIQQDLNYFFFNPRFPGDFSCSGPQALPVGKKEFLAFPALSEMEKASQ